MDLHLLNYNNESVKILHQEKVNVDKLHYIIENFDELKIEGKNDEDGDNFEGLKTHLKKYLRNCFDGQISVSYAQKNKIGRYYASHSLSLQGLPKYIRHTIAENYIDIDIVNCHPVLLYNLCVKLNLSCQCLKSYIDNRNFYIDALKKDGCENPKTLFIKIIYSDDCDYLIKKFKNKFLTDFIYEMKNIQLLLKAKHEAQWIIFEKKNKKDKNKIGSFVSLLLQDYENKILMEIYNHLKKPKDSVLCFDGLLINKNLFNKNLLHKIEKRIKKIFDIDLKLVVKPFDKTILLPDELPIYKGGDLNFYSDYFKLVGITIQPVIIDKWIANSIAFIDSGGKSCMLTKNKEFDRLTKQIISSYKMIKMNDFARTMDVKITTFNPNYDAEVSKKIKVKESKNHEYVRSDYEKEVGDEKIDTTLSKMLNVKIQSRNLPHYCGVNFVPYLKRNGLPHLYGKFNMFGGFPYDDGVESEKKINFEDSHIYAHLLNEFCNGDINECNHLLDHIADIIQQPAKVRGIGHLFYSQQGTGKGTIAFFLSKLFGSSHCVSFENIDNYFKSFNADSSNKLFKIIEEVSNKGHAFNKADVLKADLTKARERVEPKGIDPYSIDHYARYWFFTNNERALLIENSDRRYTMHRINNRHKNDMDYFAKIYEEVHDDDFCRNAFGYFATRQYAERNVMMVYENSFKVEQKILNLSSGIKFIKEIIENDYKDIPLLKTGDDRKLIKCVTLKDQYKEWCYDNGTIYNFNTLKTQTRNLKLSEEMRQIDGKTQRFYNLSFENTLQLFRTFLNEPQFCFNVLLPSNNDNDHLFSLN